MIVVYVLIGGTLLARAAGAAGFVRWSNWPAAIRVGLALMFLFTGAAHFTSLRHDLARMIPASIPAPMAWVYLTGICEIAAAAGLLIPWLTTATGWTLIVFLVAILPANIHAAQAGLTIAGEPATPLMIRIPLQAVFIGLIWWSAIRHARLPA